MGEKRCATCHRVRPVTDFNVRKAASDGRQARCRDCSREWYSSNKAAHVERVRERNARVRAENQEHLARYLGDHPCVDCGEDDVRVLDFDHEDPSGKSALVGRLATNSLPWPRVLREIAKCSVRCANCHRRRTSGMNGWWRNSAEERRRGEVREQAEARLSAILG